MFQHVSLVLVHEDMMARCRAFVRVHWPAYFPTVHLFEPVVFVLPNSCVDLLCTRNVKANVERGMTKKAGLDFNTPCCRRRLLCFDSRMHGQAMRRVSRLGRAASCAFCTTANKALNVGVFKYLVVGELCQAKIRGGGGEIGRWDK